MKRTIVAVVVLSVVLSAGSWAGITWIHKTGESGVTRKLLDKNGVTLFIVKLDAVRFFDTDNTRDKARVVLEQTFGKPVGQVSRLQPIRNWTGRLIGYAIWPT